MIIRRGGKDYPQNMSDVITNLIVIGRRKSKIGYKVNNEVIYSSYPYQTDNNSAAELPSNCRHSTNCATPLN